MKLTALLGLSLLLGGWACVKTASHGDSTRGRPVAADAVYNPSNPAPSPTIGFFGNAWLPRALHLPADTMEPATQQTETANAILSGQVTESLVIDASNVLVQTPPYIFGANANLGMGQIVNQPTLMQYIKDLSPNIIRAPAGSFSDLYFWSGTDANPHPADVPLNLLTNIGAVVPFNLFYGSNNTFYGGNNQSWTLSLTNYYNLLAQTYNASILTVNYGYARYGTGPDPVAAAAHMAADWVRYDKGKTRIWEIGNETFGDWEAGYRIDQHQNHDGQPAVVTGALYGRHVGVFADSMRAAAREVGSTIYIGATLYQNPPESWRDSTVQTWNQGVLGTVGTAADFFIVHDYFTPWHANSTVSEILSTGVNEPAAVMSYLKQQTAAAGVPMRPVAMTEWNIQASGSRQNVSYIAGMHAALTLGSLIRNQFGEASRWDLAEGYVNGDSFGMFSFGDDASGMLWNPRPVFYYMYYFRKCFGDRMVADTLYNRVNADLVTYSSTFNSGQASTVIINTGNTTHTVSISFQHFPAGANYHWYILKGGTDNAPFSEQVYVNGAGPSLPIGGPLNYASIKPYGAPLNAAIKITVPPLSTIYLMADGR